MKLLIFSATGGTGRQIVEQGHNINKMKQNSNKMTIVEVFLIITATATALMAGLFYSYSCSVNLGLDRLPDADYIAAMKSINRAIQNPVFFAGFFGTLLLLWLSTYLHYGQSPSTCFLLLLTASILYTIGVFGVTVFGNVPLNETLEKFNLPSASQEAKSAQRVIFQEPWNNFNTIRTIASILAVILVIITCLCHHKSYMTHKSLLSIT